MFEEIGSPLTDFGIENLIEPFRLEYLHLKICSKRVKFCLKV